MRKLIDWFASNRKAFAVGATVLAVAGALLLVAAFFAGRWGSARSYRVWVAVENDGAYYQTSDLVPVNILSEVGISLFPGDRVEADGELLPDPQRPVEQVPATLVIRRGRPLPLQVDGRTTLLHSSAPTLGEALAENGVILYQGDRIFPALGTPLAEVARVELIRARPLRIEVDGTLVETRSAAASVAEALLQSGITLLGLDYSIPEFSAGLPANGDISVVRVEEELLIEQKPLPFESRIEPDGSIEIDQTRMISPGSYGLISNQVRVRKENGVEVSRVREGEWVALEPEDRVVGYGTQIIIRTLDTPNGPLEYWRAVEMYATSYSPCRLGVTPHRCSYVTSSRQPMGNGVVAVLLKWYRKMKWQQVYVPNYGVGTILDVGGGIPGRHWIDLGYTDADYISWHHWTTVYFLTPVPENPVWILEYK